MQTQPAIFETHKIRRVYDEKAETWWFAVVDIIQVLTQQPDYHTARKYWNQLKLRLTREGSQSVTACHQLKLPAAAEALLRAVQSVGRKSAASSANASRTNRPKKAESAALFLPTPL